MNSGYSLVRVEEKEGKQLKMFALTVIVECQVTGRHGEARGRKCGMSQSVRKGKRGQNVCVLRDYDSDDDEVIGHLAEIRYQSGLIRFWVLKR